MNLKNAISTTLNCCICLNALVSHVETVEAANVKNNHSFGFTATPQDFGVNFELGSIDREYHNPKANHDTNKYWTEAHCNTNQLLQSISGESKIILLEQHYNEFSQFTMSHASSHNTTPTTSQCPPGQLSTPIRTLQP